jgi:serine/threonine-protein kinase
MVPAPEFQTLAEGTILTNRYRICSVLGMGGYGVVYLAEDTVNNHHKVAIKEQHKNSPEALALFRDEAALLEKLNHPNLVKVLDFFEEGGRPYLVMDFIDGRDLMSLIEDGYNQKKVMDPEAVLKLMVEVVDAVAYLHARIPPIIHRDIKPSNLRLNSSGHAILVDFGIAKTGVTTKTKLVAKAVSQGFSPPEQYGGLGHTNPSSDVYALGATLWSMLTCALPPPSAERLVKNVPLPPIRPRNPRVSEDLERIVFKAMALNALDRYHNAGEMLTALQKAGGMAEVSYVGGSVCPKCQNPSRKGARFCTKCGTSLVGAVTQCPHCNAPLRSGARFCSKCGHLNPAVAPDLAGARQHIAVGDRCLQAHDLTGAKREYSQAYHLGLQDADLYSRLGSTLLELKDFDDAVSMLEDAVRAFPTDVHLVTQLAIAYWCSDRRSQGMQVMENACRLDQGNADLARQLVVMYMDLFKYADAIPILEKLVAFTHDPEDGFRLAICCLRVDRVPDAEKLFKKLYDLDKRHPGVLYYLGIVNMKKCKPRDALKFFHEAVKYDPNHALAYYFMGDILRSERKFREAADALRHSIQADPEDPDTYVQLALCLIEMRRPDEARDAIRRALALDPEHKMGLQLGHQLGVA